MRTLAHLKKTAVSLTLGTMLALSAVVPAFADDSAPVSQDVDPGVLTSVVTTDPVFTAVTYSHTAQVSASTTGLVIEVDDSRGTGEGWNVTLASSDLAYSGTNTGGSAILASQVSASVMNAPTSNAGDDTTGVLAGTAGALGTARTVLDAAAGAGEGNYSQTIDLEIAIPAQAAAGSYTGTLTLTQASGPSL